MPDDGMLAVAARRRLTAGGHRAALRQDHGAAVSLLERAAALVPPAELDLVLEIELSDALVWTGRADDALRRADALAERALGGGRSRRRALWECPGGACSASTSSRRARRRSCPRSSSRRCRCSRRPATTWRCTSPTPRWRRWRSCAGRWERAGGVRAGLRPRSAGGPPTACVHLRLAPLLASSARLPCRNCSPGSTRTSHERGGTTSSVRTGPGRWPCSGASTKRARSSPRRVHELAERGGGLLLAQITAFGPPGSSSGQATPPPQTSSEQQGSGCSRSWGNRARCRPRLGIWRSRSTRLTGSTRPTPGRAARRSSARATTSRRRCSGGRSGQSCSRAAASTPRRSSSPVRRWRSARKPTPSTTKATRTPISPRCSCSVAKTTRR